MDKIENHELDDVLRGRLDEASRATAKKERQTIMSFFEWLVRRKILLNSPAADLETILSAGDRAKFRTVKEIEETLGRGGLTDEEVVANWSSIYLTPKDRRDPGPRQGTGRVRLRPPHVLHRRVHWDAAG